MNTLYIDRAYITVQSCDDKEANIGVFVGTRGAYHHVNLPSLTRQWKPKSFNYTELPDDIFDRLLEENRHRVLELIGRLNGTVCDCEYVPSWLIPGSPCANCGLPPYIAEDKTQP